MQSFEAYFIFSCCIISIISSANVTNYTNITSTTIKPIDRSQGDILWSRYEDYTCSNLIPAINIFYNISQTECESRCLSFFNNSIQCTTAVWYEFIKPTGNDVPRCYLFGQSCELVIDITKPVTTSFWYYNITEDINCVNYPSNWKDNYFDTCDAYELFNFCDYAYNSSTTAILTYQDTIYGFDALKVCCGCNGGLINYANQFLLEPKWKPTSILNIYEDYNDFICETVDITATTNILINEQGILENDKLNFTQFVGICQHIHSSLYDKYKLLLSITTENNNMINVKNIYSDFQKFKHFSCIDNLLLYNVTICNHTDYNNLYPFIIDLEEDHIYINNNYIHSDTFLYHIPPTNIYIKSFCSFSKLLETIYPTKPPTKEPTFEPTFEPTIYPTIEPTSNPTQPTLQPSKSPSKSPTYEPTLEPTNIPTTEPTTEPTSDPTGFPSGSPTYEPTIEPTNIPTNEPTIEPTSQPTETPSETPTYEPTTEPTNIPTNEPTTEPTTNPSKFPSINPTITPTKYPTKDPSFEPTTEPTTNPSKFPSINPSTSPSKYPTNIPTKTPSNNPTQPTYDPTFEPTMEPTLNPNGRRLRRLLNHYYSTPYFKTNIIAAFLCQTSYTKSPTISPTKYPTIEPTDYIIQTEIITTTEEIKKSNDESNTLSSGAVAGIVIGTLVLCILIIVLMYIFVFKNIKYSKQNKNNMDAVRPPSGVGVGTDNNTVSDNDNVTEHKDNIEMPEITTPNINSVSDNDSEHKDNIGITAPNINSIPDNGQILIPPPIPSAPVSDNDSDNDSDSDDEKIDYSFKNKRMRNWNNDEILNWIKCMKLDTELNDKIVTQIETNECTGEDIMELKTADDVSDAFEIVGNKILCKRIVKEIKNFKPNLKGIDTFNINLFINNSSGGENVTLDEEFNKSDTIFKIKTRFKIQKNIDFEIKHIKFKYKKKILLDSKTLSQCGIKSENHLIDVEIDDVFYIHIFSQGNDLTLSNKVSQDYRIKQIKEMYKNQSGVYADINDIHFKYKKKELLDNKTLQQCGIQDDKHLITVRFETGGGGEFSE